MQLLELIYKAKNIIIKSRSDFYMPSIGSILIIHQLFRFSMPNQLTIHLKMLIRPL